MREQERDGERESTIQRNKGEERNIIIIIIILKISNRMGENEAHGEWNKRWNDATKR